MSGDLADLTVADIIDPWGGDAAVSPDEDLELFMDIEAGVDPGFGFRDVGNLTNPGGFVSAAGHNKGDRMLKIINAGDARADHILAVITALPGAGKTTLGLSSRKGVVIATIEAGLHRAVNRDNSDAIKVANWGDIQDIKPDDFEGRGPAVVDTGGAVVARMYEDIQANMPKIASDARKWGPELRRRFDGWLLGILQVTDVVVLSHVQEEDDEGQARERMVMIGSAKQTLYAHADLMARLVEKEDGSRILTAAYTKRALTKSPAGFEPMLIQEAARDPYVLDTVIARVKACLDAEANDRKNADDALDEWRSHLETLASPDEFTRATGEANGKTAADTKTMQRMLMDAATAAGMVWKKASKSFTADPAKKPAATGADTGEPATRTEGLFA